MQFWNFYKAETFYYKEKEMNNLREKVEQERSIFYNLETKGQTLFYTFNMNRQIRLDYLLEFLDDSIIVLTQIQLLTLIYQVGKLLLQHKQYFIDCDLQNIWLHLNDPLKINKKSQNLNYLLQLVNLRQINEQQINEQNNKGVDILKQIYYSSQLNQNRINIINFQDMNLERLIDYFYGALQILEKNQKKEEQKEVLCLSDVQINELMLIIQKFQVQGKITQSKDYFQNLKSIELTSIYIHQLKIYNCSLKSSFLQIVFNSNQNTALINQINSYFKSSKIDLNYFQQFLEEKYQLLQQKIDQKCNNFTIPFTEEFKKVLVDHLIIEFLDYLFTIGKLNSTEFLVQFNSNEQIRKDLFKTLTEIRCESCQILQDQFKSKVEQKTMEILNQLQ